MWVELYIWYTWNDTLFQTFPSNLMFTHINSHLKTFVFHPPLSYYNGLLISWYHTGWEAGGLGGQDDDKYDSKWIFQSFILVYRTVYRFCVCVCVCRNGAEIIIFAKEGFKFIDRLVCFYILVTSFQFLLSFKLFSSWASLNVLFSALSICDSLLVLMCRHI